MRFSAAWLAALAVVATAEPNFCRTSSRKGFVECRVTPSDGPIDVYADSLFPTTPRKLHVRSGKFCESEVCERCLANASGDVWRSCRGKGVALPVVAKGNNLDLPPSRGVLFALLLLAVPIVVFGALRQPQRAARAGGPAGRVEGTLAYILGFAAQPWFPLVAGFATALNMFTIVFTGATVVLYLSSVLGNPRRWRSAAVVNAAGATLGTAVLLLLVRERGLEWMSAAFPSLLASPAWAKATRLMQTYGLGGMLLVSCLPIILHPVIAFGMLGDMSNATILAVVMLGRTIKYLTMAYVTVRRPLNHAWSGRACAHTHVAHGPMPAMLVKWRRPPIRLTAPLTSARLSGQLASRPSFLRDQD